MLCGLPLPQCDDVCTLVVISRAEGTAVPSSPAVEKAPLSLSLDLSIEILDCVDVDALQNTLMTLLGSSSQSHTPEDIPIVENCMALWVATVIHRPSLLSSLIALESTPALFNALLLCPDAQAIRRETGNAIYHICATVPSSPPPSGYFLDLLLLQVDTITASAGMFSRVPVSLFCSSFTAQRRLGSIGIKALSSLLS